MIDMQTTRVSALNNRVPSAILLVEVIGAATALGLMALYLAILSRGVVTVLLAAGLLTLLLFVTFDLDRPARGFITVPGGAAGRAPRLDGAAAGRRGPSGSLAGKRAVPSRARVGAHEHRVGDLDDLIGGEVGARGVLADLLRTRRLVDADRAEAAVALREHVRADPRMSSDISLSPTSLDLGCSRL